MTLTLLYLIFFKGKCDDLVQLIFNDYLESLAYLTYFVSRMVQVVPVLEYTFKDICRPHLLMVQLSRFPNLTVLVSVLPRQMVLLFVFLLVLPDHHFLPPPSWKKSTAPSLQIRVATSPISVLTASDSLSYVVVPALLCDAT